MSVNIGDNLKMIRLQNGLTIKQVISLLNDLNLPISIQTLYKWEANKITPDIRSLNTLAGIYSVNVGSFFNDNSRFQSLNENEERLLTLLHKYKVFRKIIFLIMKIYKEVR